MTTIKHDKHPPTPYTHLVNLGEAGDLLQMAGMQLFLAECGLTRAIHLQCVIGCITGGALLGLLQCLGHMLIPRCFLCRGIQVEGARWNECLGLLSAVLCQFVFVISV